MGAGHSHALYLPGTSPLHRARPQCKLAAAFLFILAVVSTPREAFWAFGVYALVLTALARLAGLPLATLARRLVIELPFLLFAVFMPLVGQGERVEVLGVPLATEGLWAAWNIVVKGTLGVATSVILAATTPVPELLRGLERLRLPAAFTTVASFMVRYLDVITDEVRRMRIARVSRGYDPRWIWQVRALAATAGTLFIRSYERGERVYLAMVSRGYAGSMPDLRELAATRGQWLAALALPAVAALVAATAWGLRP
ncbi:MAG TPA: cobalt ECF transporter T component CbiQ [Actinomycetota bacterium]|nr:cobalt ECF transporter T component CbiQ [Actinomycetota bacterium]